MLITQDAIPVGILGRQAVGKTLLQNIFLEEKQQPLEYIATNGIDSKFKTIHIGSEIESNSIKIRFRDTTGNAIFESVINKYLQDFAIVVLVINPQDADFESQIENTAERVTQYAGADVPIIIVANTWQAAEYVAPADGYATKLAAHFCCQPVVRNIHQDYVPLSTELNQIISQVLRRTHPNLAISDPLAERFVASRPWSPLLYKSPCQVASSAFTAVVVGAAVALTCTFIVGLPAGWPAGAWVMFTTLSSLLSACLTYLGMTSCFPSYHTLKK